jgi:hypothetical protein
MSNLFYNATGSPQTGSQGLSSVIRNEFQAIAAGFDALPALSLTGGYSVTLVGVGAYSYTLPATAGTLALAANITTAVAAETSRATAAEAAETSRATAAEATLTTSVSTETSRATAAEALLAPKLNPTITGLHEVALAVAALNIDCNAGAVFTKTITTNSTFTVSNVPSSGTVASFVLELTNGGSHTVTWWSGVKWANAAAPVLTTSGIDLLGFYTADGGSTWRGLVLAKAIA